LNLSWFLSWHSSFFTTLSNPAHCTNRFTIYGTKSHVDSPVI